MRTLTILAIILLAACSKTEQYDNNPMYKASFTVVSSGANAISYKYNQAEWLSVFGADSTVAAFNYIVGDTVFFKSTGTNATTIVKLNGHTFGDPINHCGEIEGVLLIK